MTAFWQGLARANAKAVFACAVAALVGVAGWYVWKLAVARPVAAFARPDGGARGDAPADLGLAGLLEREIAQSATNISPDPFYFVARTRPPDAPTTRSTDTPAPAPRPAPAPTPRPTPTPDVPREAPRTVQLIYRGVFIRPDGITVALIENGKTGHGMTATNGARMFGLELAAISNDHVSVRTPDGGQVSISRGETRTFPEP